MRTHFLCGIFTVVEPFTSNDTYVCPDCGSEVKVGARSCPACGPFRPMQQEDDEQHVWPQWEEGEDDSPKPPAFPFHSMTTYTDSREILERSRRPTPERPPAIPIVLEEKSSRFARTLLIILGGLTILSAGLAIWRVLRP